ncbi:uncharacterized protein LOC112148617 isoform X2 [Oryzias melastigma]|uniref:uncharacterized protein LOC112148617 isoform X2 n=1 Tax=Oryzias melastigma TaxID=30732 RepID=UPI000CF7E64B|nr:uncharacterized protein LOC112148617 isoform X2 [Oryzias melastigma]
MTVTLALITSLLSPCCQQRSGYLCSRVPSPSAAMGPRGTALFTLWLCSAVFSSAPSPFLTSEEEPGCFKVNSCKCIMKDGSGVINLKAVGDADGFLERLRPVPADNMSASAEIFLSFSPCQHFSEPEAPTLTDCTDVAACLIVRHKGLSGHKDFYTDYGTHEGNEFHYNHTQKTLSVTYFARRPQAATVVHYHCDPRQSTSIVQRTSLVPGGPLLLWVESPCACPNACGMGDLGLGTIFLILLSLSAAAYFVLGSSALRASRSNSGMQISPECSVWCMICYLCSERPARKRRTNWRP